MVPRILTPERKETRMNICADILQNTENDRNFLGNAITSDESWLFQYDPETKRQSMHRKSHTSRKKKAWKSKSNFKAMMMVFFYIQGTVQLIGCLKVRPLTRSTIRRLSQPFVNRWPEMWKNGSWILHHDNAPPHNARVCQVVSGEAKDPRVGTSTLLTWPSPMLLFFPQRLSLH
jgi:hypothetical protein